MNRKLKVGMAFENNGPRHTKMAVSRLIGRRTNKRLKLPKIDWTAVSVVEIFRSFWISALVMVNTALIVFAVGWFTLLFSFISPTELISMYGVYTASAEVVQTQTEISDLSIRPAPALSDN